MTGTARIQGRPGGVPVTIFLRSVNHKYLDLSFRLPPVLQSFEEKLSDLVRKKVARGRVDIEISGRLAFPRPYLNRPVLDEYRRIIRGLGGDPGRAEHWPALLKMPGVMTVEERFPRELDGKAFWSLVDSALERLIRSRAREGRKIENLFRRYLKRIDSLAGKIKVRHGKSRGENLRRFQDEAARIQDSGRNSADGAASKALAQVFLEWFEKFTIAEELERIRMHTAEIAGLLSAPGPVGRQIEFYTQELHREVNTIGSKARDFQIRKMVVELKTIIEDMKEQVRNLC